MSQKMSEELYHSIKVSGELKRQPVYNSSGFIQTLTQTYLCKQFWNRYEGRLSEMACYSDAKMLSVCLFLMYDKLFLCETIHCCFCETCRVVIMSFTLI